MDQVLFSYSSSRVSWLFFFFFFWLCWVFVSVRGLSLVAASGGHSSLRCMGLSLSRPLLLRSTGSRRAGSVVVAHGPSCSVACGIFPDQGSNPCPLHWQADSQPLRHQGNPSWLLLVLCVSISILGSAYQFSQKPSWDFDCNFTDSLRLTDILFKKTEPSIS